MALNSVVKPLGYSASPAGVKKTVVGSIPQTTPISPVQSSTPAMGYPARTTQSAGSIPQYATPAQSQPNQGSIPRASQVQNPVTYGGGMSASPSSPNIAPRTGGSIPSIYTPNSTPQAAVGADANTRTIQDKQAYIDSAHPGGFQNYVKTQQDRYNQAIASNNLDLLNALNADSVRLGFSLQTADVAPTTPVNDTPTPAPVDFRSLAMSEFAPKLADLKSTRDQRLSSLSSGWNQSQASLKDQRVLDNLFFERNNNPFGGQYDYRSGLMGREREQQDAAALANYNNQVAGANSDYANQESTYQDQIGARAYQLQQDALANQRADAGLTGVLPNGTQTLAAKSQTFNQGMATKTFDRNVTESDRSFNMAKAQQEWQQTFQQGQFDQNKAQQLWDNNFKDKTFGQQVKSEAASRGLQWANLDESRKARIANDLFREKSFSYQKEHDANQETLQKDQLKFSKGMDLFKASGKMPAYMSDYGIDVSGMNSPTIKGDLSAMYDMLSKGTDPASLIKTIDDKVSMGIENKAVGDQLKAAIFKVHPELDPNQPKPDKFAADGSYLNPWQSWVAPFASAWNMFQ